MRRYAGHAPYFASGVLKIPLNPELSIVIGLGVTSGILLVAGLTRDRQHAKVARRLELMRPRAGRTFDDNLVQDGSTGLGRFVLFGEADRKEVVTALRAAGTYRLDAPAIFGVLRLGGATLAAAATILVLWQQAAWTGMHRLYPLGAFVACFVGAKTVLKMRVSARLRRVHSELPFVLDLLVLMLESGVSLDQCFRQIALLDSGGMRTTRQVNVMLVDDLQNGMGYEPALDRWAERLAVPGARELSSLFRQSLLYGTELGPALHVFVQEFSDKRISAARESIGKKTTQITVVMILFLMPSLFIMLAGPAVVAIKAALSGMAQ